MEKNCTLELLVIESRFPGYLTTSQGTTHTRRYHNIANASMSDLRYFTKDWTIRQILWIFLGGCSKKFWSDNMRNVKEVPTKNNSL